MSDPAGQLTALLRAIQSAAAADVPLARLARVVAYRPPPEDRADVQPIVGTSIEGVAVPAPVLPGLPVEWLASAGGAVTVPLAPGDLVELVPQQVDQSGPMSGGADGQLPAIADHGHQGGAFVRPLAPGPRGKTIAATAYSAAGPVISGAQVFLGSATAADYVALASLVKAELERLWAAVLTCSNTGGTITTITPYAYGNAASTKIHAE